MKKKIFIISLIALCLCGCGKVSKLKNGSDAVVSFEKLDSISVDSLYDSLKDRYAISMLIDMIDKEILFKERIQIHWNILKSQRRIIQKERSSRCNFRWIRKEIRRTLRDV